LNNTFCIDDSVLEGSDEDEKSSTLLKDLDNGEVKFDHHDKNCVKMFDVLLCIPCDKIDKVLVHKGKDPSIDIRCYEEFVKNPSNEERKEKLHQICLVFTGDMERQQFIDQIYRCKEQLENDPGGTTGGYVGENKYEDTIKTIKENKRKKEEQKKQDKDLMILDDSDSDEPELEAPIYD